MKKFLSILLSLAILLTLTMPAMATEGSTTIYFDNTAGWTTVNAYAFEAENNVYLGQWPGTAMTYVEGNFWSVAVPTGATTIIFNDGSDQTADLTIPTDGSNLYTYNSGWSAYTPAPKTEGDVTASYTPTAAITGVSLIVDDVEYSSGSVTLTDANAVQLKVYGTNLNYGTTSNQVMFKDGYVVPMGSGYAWVFSDDGTSATYSMEVDDFSNVTTMYTLRYSNDNESTWNDSDVSVIYSSGEETTYTITVVESSNGTVVADKETATAGEIVTLTITPNEGYELSELTITYTDAEGTGAFGVNEYNSFTMPAFDVTITATFVEDTATETPCLTITIDGTTYTNENTSANNPALIYSNSDAVITVYGDNLVANVSGFYTGYDRLCQFYEISSDGTSATLSTSIYHWRPDTVYEICYTIDGTEKLSSGVYVQTDTGLKPGTYNVNVNNTYDGGHVVSQQATAAENDLVTLSVDTDYGYKLSSLTVSDGTNEIATSKVDDTTYTFTMPASEVTVTPVFEEITVARVTGFKLTVDGKDYTEGTAHVTADSQSVSVTLTGTDLNLMTTCTLGLYENVTFTNGEANVTVSDDGTSAVLTIDPTSFTTAFSWSITYQLEGDSLNYSDVQLSYLTDTGTDLTAIYFKNSGGWETIQADFYDQNRGFLSTVTLTLVPGETDIYSTTEIPAYAYWVYFDNGEDLFTEIREIPMAAVGTDQYNPDSDTWTKFTATQHVTNSFEITWGSMAFTYSDEQVTTSDGATADKGWSNDGTTGAGTVTVTNTGEADFTASAAYTSTTTDYGTITGTLGDAQELSANASGTFTLTLSGKPTKAIPAGTKIGEVTITINEAAES